MMVYATFSVIFFSLLILPHFDNFGDSVQKIKIKKTFLVFIFPVQAVKSQLLLPCQLSYQEKQDSFLNEVNMGAESTVAGMGDGDI